MTHLYSVAAIYGFQPVSFYKSFFFPCFSKLSTERFCDSPAWTVAWSLGNKHPLGRLTRRYLWWNTSWPRVTALCKMCQLPRATIYSRKESCVLTKIVVYFRQRFKYQILTTHFRAFSNLFCVLCLPIQSLTGPQLAFIDPSSFSSRWKIMSILSILLFLLGSLLAAAETAATTLWPWKLKELAESSGYNSPFQILEKDITRFLTTILVASTTVMVFVTAFTTEAATKLFGDMAFGYTSALMTVFFLFFGEILPKSLAVSNPVLVLRATLPIVSFLSLMLYPVGKLFAVFAKTILRVFRITVEDTTAVSEEELRLIAAGAGRSGSIERYEQDMIEGVLDLEETKVCEIMCPRVEMVSISAEASLKDLLRLEKDHHYSRTPVYEDSIDKITGIVYFKSLLQFLNEPEQLETVIVRELMEPVFFVPESMPVWNVLEQMKKKRQHMAIVVDEYGGTAGLVTLEDIVEEIVGEIYDEDDVDENTEYICQVSEGVYSIKGNTNMEHLCKVLEGLSLSHDPELDQFETISGVICHMIGRIPDVGETLHLGNYLFTIMQTDDRRILLLRVEKQVHSPLPSETSSSLVNGNYSASELEQ
ncbi:Putative DUF21 domain-containing protein At3g13070, chloroplastic [Galdieria sulphuraria]|nr:Putative DUF21 domain-containing protein At3g13070, chloroplastic [Galdieria sulphuraria]